MSDTYDFSTTSELNTETSKGASGGKAKKDETEVSVLDRLREQLAKKVERPRILIEVPERPGLAIEVSPNITQHQMRAWRKNAGEGTKPGFDPTKFACYVIGHTTTGIYMGTEEVLAEAGHSLSFASQDILDMTGTTRPIPDCIQAFFGLDPHVEAAALTIMEAAGYGDDVETVDPTTES
jgi:hypothetical protein